MSNPRQLAVLADETGRVIAAHLINELPTRRVLRNLVSLLVVLGVLLLAAPAFASGYPPHVWEFSNVYTVGATVDGGQEPGIYFKIWHEFTYQRAGEPVAWPPQESDADGLGRHVFEVAMPNPNNRRAWVTGRKCWTDFTPFGSLKSCTDWAPWRLILAQERPGASGEIRGLGNKCVEADANRTAGAAIQYWQCWGGNNQKWRMTATDNLQSFVGRCLTALGSWNGARNALNDCIDYITQRWSFINAQIRGLGSKCIDAPNGNTSNGTQPQIWDCNGSGAQVFNFMEFSGGEIRGPGNKCLDAYNFGTANGTRVVFWDCNGLANQKWHIGSNGEIRGYGNKCLEVANIDPHGGAKLQTWDCWGGTNQKWYVTGHLQGYGGCLDLPGGNTADGTPMQMWQCLANDAYQIFTYTP